MSAVERLAAAMKKADQWDRTGYSEPFERYAKDTLAADPTLAADIELGAAWRRAEAALPEGWRFLRLSQTVNAPTWLASAFSPAMYGGGFAEGIGPTPTAALTALAEKLENVDRVPGRLPAQDE